MPEPIVVPKLNENYKRKDNAIGSKRTKPVYVRNVKARG